MVEQMPMTCTGDRRSDPPKGKDLQLRGWNDPACPYGVSARRLLHGVELSWVTRPLRLLVGLKLRACISPIAAGTSSAV
jgi:hypothetical protein